MSLSDFQEDTIVAVATPPGRGAVSLVRLSGRRVREIGAACLLWSPERFLPRRAQLARFHGRSGEPLDRVLATFFPEPNSYTGEDVLELSCHGSPVVVAGILENCAALGARLARPGEFTLRAFLQGKIDLIQAEAVRDLVESQTAYQAEVARRQLEGGVSAALQPLKEELVDVAAHLETAVEFVEDDVEPEERGRLDRRLGEVEKALSGWVESYQAGRVVREGATVVLAGRPNTGKSSIFNRLLRFDRAIVTPLPGTTRDALREVIDLGGIPVCLIDTAGIRTVGDLVERKGVERSVRETREADLVLLVQDGEAGMEAEDRRVWTEVGDRPYVVVRNKCDLRRDWKVADEIEAGSRGCAEVSALTGEGMGTLAELAAAAVIPGGIDGGGGAVVTDLRQKGCLEAALERLRRARAALAEGLSEEFASYEIQRCLEAVGELTGETTAEDILDRVFSSFCIGK